MDTSLKQHKGLNLKKSFEKSFNPCLWQALGLDVAQQVLRVVHVHHLKVQEELVDELGGGGGPVARARVAVAQQVDLADARGEEGDDAGEDGADGVPLAHRAPVHDHGEALLLGARHHGQVVLEQQVLRGEGLITSQDFTVS